ncbi:hypothetical protein FOCC_FOCC000345 [Frankliniella occidentalis]|nr:hypothetical protein FOCC_FOCC000345 [Frankliniella occidentalis]
MRPEATRAPHHHHQGVRGMDLDEILPDVGEFGAYQQLLLWFVLLPGVLPCGFHAYNQLFMAASPPHWCHVPELDALNISHEWARNLSIPAQDQGGGFSQCRMYRRNYTRVAAAVEQALGQAADVLALEAALAALVPAAATWRDLVVDDANQSVVMVEPADDEGATVPCAHGYAFDYSQYATTVVTEDRAPARLLHLPAHRVRLRHRHRLRARLHLVDGVPHRRGLHRAGHHGHAVRARDRAGGPLQADGRHHPQQHRLLAVARGAGRRGVPGAGLAAARPRHLRALRQLLPVLVRKFQMESAPPGAGPDQPAPCLESVERSYGVLDLVRTPNLRRKTLIITFIWSGPFDYKHVIDRAQKHDTLLPHCPHLAQVHQH